MFDDVRRRKIDTKVYYKKSVFYEMKEIVVLVLNGKWIEKKFHYRSYWS